MLQSGHRTASSTVFVDNALNPKCVLLHVMTLILSQPILASLGTYPWEKLNSFHLVLTKLHRNPDYMGLSAAMTNIIR